MSIFDKQNKFKPKMSYFEKALLFWNILLDLLKPAF